jgi:hypothetical protein
MSALQHVSHGKSRQYPLQVASIPRSICKQRAQPPKLLRPGLGRSGENDARAGCQKIGIAAAMRLHANCCLGGSPGFCQIAI